MAAAVKVGYNVSSSEDSASDGSGEDDFQSEEHQSSLDAESHTSLSYDPDGSDESFGEEQYEGTQPVKTGPSKTGSGAVADVMAKILGKKVPPKQTAILAKAKTDKEISLSRKRKQKEEEGSDAGDEDDREDDTDRPDVNAIEKRKRWEELGRVKPALTDREKERSLQRIATRGVVQLFNAVKKQQKLLEDRLKEVGGSVVRQEKVLQSVTKGKFMDILKGTTTSNVSSEPKEADQKMVAQSDTKSRKGVTAEPQDKPSWSILREDFMMGAKMKDWNKMSDSDDAGEDGLADGNIGPGGGADSTDSDT